MIIVNVTDINKHIDTLTDALESMRELISKAYCNPMEEREITDAFTAVKMLADTLIYERDRKKVKE
jgi:hypothetical protein